MSAETWQAEFSPLAPGGRLRNPQAAALVQFLRRYAHGVATLLQLRRRKELELVVLDIRTAAPQTPAYPICPTERVGVLFWRDGAMPLVVVLRDDFPDTEHQLLVPPGFPAAICIDDRPWADASLTWTPAELTQRILMWFQRAARDELHDARQPLDPFFLGTGLSFIIDRSFLTTDTTGDLIAEFNPDQATMLRVRRVADVPQMRAGMEPICIATYRVPPNRMQRLRHAPVTLGDLASILGARGVDIYSHLATRFASWLAEGKGAAWRLKARLAVVVEMPIVSPRDEHRAGVDFRAFLSAQPAGDIAVALGIAFRSNAQHGSTVGWAPRVGPPAVNYADANAIAVQAAEVHVEFGRDSAATLAGRAAPDTQAAVLVGAGAIGSHLADCLIRDGRFRWTIIDDDRLLPHNLARHIARDEHVSHHKAAVLADHLNAILTDEDAVARPLTANLFAAGDDGVAVTAALSGADLIIDASASLAVARSLSDHRAAARRLSAFLTPSGQAAIVLAEPADRAPTLRDLEAQYLGLVLRTPRLSDHLAPPEIAAYTGACRAVTSRIPQSRVSVLAGLAAIGLAKAMDGSETAVSIWTLTRDCEVVYDSAPAERVSRYWAHGWQISIDDGLAARILAMRNDRLPRETGGLLFGLVDIPAKSIHLVHASAAPTDSIERPGEFIRGTAGVEAQLEEVGRKTGGQVRYVGEWHSHPPRASAYPSAVDADQIDWLAALMQLDAIPALMLIAADTRMALVFAREHAQRGPADQADDGSAGEGFHV